MTSGRLPTLLALLAVLGVSSPPCQGQEGARVTLQFLSFPKAIDPAPVELVTGEGKTIEVALPSNELSAPYKVPGMGTWTLGETTEGDDGKPAFKVFGQARALLSSSQLILVVKKGADDADGLELIPIDNSVTQFGGGKFLFMNAATVDIAGKLGSEEFAIKPGRHAIIQPRAAAGKRTVHTTFWFRSDKKPKPFFSSAWPVSDGARSLVFFYHDPRTQRLRLHSVRDFR